jgi:hypothetical protein
MEELQLVQAKRENIQNYFIPEEKVIFFSINQF